ncbi:hypothetical protein ACVWW2_004790 [Bradyrhizobium sp. LM4.3]
MSVASRSGSSRSKSAVVTSSDMACPFLKTGVVLDVAIWGFARFALEGRTGRCWKAPASPNFNHEDTMAKADADVTSEHRLFPPRTSGEPGFVLFVCLASLREDLRARQQQQKTLPRYVERNPRDGHLSFRVDRGAGTPLPNDPTTREFRAAYNAALVHAIAAEDDSDDWTELQRHHDVHRARKQGELLRE